MQPSEIVSLDLGRDDTEDGKGWIAIEDKGLLLTLTGKTGWREVEIGRGSCDQTCPFHALEQYMHYTKIDFGPLFQRVSRADLPQAERLKLFSGHSLRAGLTTSANVDERYIIRNHAV